MTRHRQGGVTLMEVLIAVSLLSLLSVGMLFSIRVGLSAMGRTNDRLLSNRRVAGVERIFHQQIAGFMAVRADCRINPVAPPQTVAFFQGEPQTMRFVSTYSLAEASRGAARILEYQVIPGEGGQGVRLVLNELLYGGAHSTGQLCAGVVPDPATGAPQPAYRPVQLSPQSFVLADRLASCRMLYREEPEAPQSPRWVERWRRERPPTAIRIEMYPLDMDPAKLQLQAVTAPVRVNRDPMAMYVDIPEPKKK